VDITLFPPSEEDGEHREDGDHGPKDPKKESTGDLLSLRKDGKGNKEIQKKEKEKPDQPGFGCSFSGTVTLAAIHCDSSYPPDDLAADSDKR
jgi:hypothetical protein